MCKYIYMYIYVCVCVCIPALGLTPVDLVYSFS